MNARLVPVWALLAAFAVHEEVVPRELASGWQKHPSWDDGRAEHVWYRITDGDESASARVVSTREAGTLRTHWVEGEARLTVHLSTSDARPIRVSLVQAPLYKEWSAELGELHTHREGDEFGGARHHLIRSPYLVFYDHLGVRLRGLGGLEEGEFVVDLVDTLHGSNTRPIVHEALVEVGREKTIAVPAGLAETRVVVVRHAGRLDTLYFLREAPHLLVRWDRHDGRQYVLEKLERR